MCDKEELVLKFINKLNNIIKNIDNICNDDQVHKVSSLISMYLSKTPYEAVDKIGPQLIADPIKTYILEGINDKSILVVKELICKSETLSEYVNTKYISDVLENKWKGLSDKNKKLMMLKSRKLLHIYASYLK